MVITDAVIGEEVTALAPREVVWKVLTNQETWKEWWGGAIQKVVPGWQDGGANHWEHGSPSQIERCAGPEELVLVGSSGTKSRFHLQPGTRGNYVVTSIRYEEDFSSSRLTISDPNAVRAQVRSTLVRLMSRAELQAARSQPESEPSRLAEKKWWHFWN